jgi:hypothetical protein
MLLGGMTGGPLDKPFNRGMYELVEMLEPQAVEVWTWGQWAEACQRIEDTWHEGDQLVIIGYSGGASRGTYLCNHLDPIRVDLLIGYDPSPAGQMRPLRANVVKAVCYYNERPLMWWPGVGKLGGGHFTTRVPEGPPALEMVTIAQQHLCVQHNCKLHMQTINRVNSL